MQKGIRFLSGAFLVFFTLIAFLAFFPTSACAATLPEADVPLEIVEETFIPLEDNIMERMGWLTVEAALPSGFEGVICVELQNKSTRDLETVQLDAQTWYIGGSWLPVGTYTVKRAYVLDSDHFTVEWSDTEAVISHEEDACLALNISSDAAFEDTLENIMATFTPNPPTEASEETTAPTADNTAAATEPSAETAATEYAAETVSTESAAEEFSSGQWGGFLAYVLTAAVFVGIVFLAVYLAQKNRND